MSNDLLDELKIVMVEALQAAFEIAKGRHGDIWNDVFLEAISACWCGAEWSTELEIPEWNAAPTLSQLEDQPMARLGQDIDMGQHLVHMAVLKGGEDIADS